MGENLRMVLEHIWPKIRVLHYLHSDSNAQAVAHCLDLDLIATGPDQETALSRLNAVVKAQVEFALTHGNFDLLSTRAPNKYWEQFQAGHRLPSIQIEFRVPEVIPVHDELAHVGVLIPAEAQIAA